jgi:hypothetical protein
MKPLAPTALAVLSIGALLAENVAAGPASTGLPGIRPLGMGNAFVAVADDRNALYYNPAGLSNLDQTKISGIGLQGGIDDEFFEVIEFIQDNEERFADFDEIDQEFYESLAPYDDRWVSADAQAYVDVTRKNLGVGVYSLGRVGFSIDRGVYEPRVRAHVFDDIVALVGGSMDLGRYDLTVGGTLKGVWRRESRRALTSREVADFDPEEILDDLEGADAGFAMDLGVRWARPGSRWAVGAVLRDAAGFVGGEKIGAAFDLGTAWRPEIGDWGPVRGVLLAADLRNMLDSNEATGNKIHLGAEVRMPVVSVRGGVNQGYPAVGASIGLRFFELDYAFYGRELGEYPGSESQFLHTVEVRLGYF